MQTLISFICLGDPGRLQQVPEGAGDGHHRQRQKVETFKVGRGRRKCYPGKVVVFNFFT